MNNIKEHIFKDYINNNTNKILKIRNKIFNCKFKIKKIFLIRKYNKLLFKCQSFFPLSKKISNNITFPHGITGIFISCEATIGDGCTIFQQVTIGSNTLPNSKSSGIPIIGKNCYIGAGAKIIGNVKIGDNCRIGANTTVTKDIPDNSTVVGAKFRIISHNEKLNNHFVSIDKYK